jgi:hypothetical protein
MQPVYPPTASGVPHPLPPPRHRGTAQDTQAPGLEAVVKVEARKEANGMNMYKIKRIKDIAAIIGVGAASVGVAANSGNFHAQIWAIIAGFWALAALVGNR